MWHTPRHGLPSRMRCPGITRRQVDKVFSYHQPHGPVKDPAPRTPTSVSACQAARTCLEQPALDRTRSGCALLHRNFRRRLDTDRPERRDHLARTRRPLSPARPARRRAPPALAEGQRRHLPAADAGILPARPPLPRAPPGRFNPALVRLWDDLVALCQSHRAAAAADALRHLLPVEPLEAPPLQPRQWRPLRVPPQAAGLPGDARRR